MVYGGERGCNSLTLARMSDEDYSSCPVCMCVCVCVVFSILPSRALKASNKRYQLHYAYMVDSQWFWIYRACWCACVCCCLYSRFSFQRIRFSPNNTFSPTTSCKQPWCNWAQDHRNGAKCVDFYTPVASPIIHIISSWWQGILLTTDKAGHAPRPSIIANTLLVGCRHLEWSCCTSFSPPPVPMLPPAQPGPSYQQPSPSSSISPLPTHPRTVYLPSHHIE